MDLSFNALRAGILADWERMIIPPAYLPVLDKAAARLIRDKAFFVELENATTVPPLVSIVIAERESGDNPQDGLAQGDPWDKVSIHAPRGLGPYASRLDAAVAALKLVGLDKVGRGNWSIELALWFHNKYNGFGPNLHGYPSGYVWAPTNIYRGGKFDYDYHWNPAVYDSQMGCAPLSARLIKQDPTLAIPGMIVPSDHPSVIEAPYIPTTLEVQKKLIALGLLPAGSDDGIYGPKTRTAIKLFQQASGLLDDGRAGVLTWAKMEPPK
jgi:lysozyme family protein